MITVAELNAFTGNYETNTTKQTLIESAESVVTAYLGYSPISAQRVYRFTGWGADYCVLPVPHVTALTSITIGDTILDIDMYSIDSDTVQLSGAVFTRGAVCTIVYTAGWPADAIPAAIKHACLRIAALMLDETQGNIGVTGKQYADLSKQFVSYTNYNKYLAPLAAYRRESL